MVEKTQEQIEEARRQRKRVLDRNAQRTLRLKTKKRIAYLEQLVQDLQCQNADERAKALERRLAEVEKERDDLISAFATMDKVLSNARQSLMTRGLDSSKVARHTSSNGDVGLTRRNTSERCLSDDGEPGRLEPEVRSPTTSLQQHENDFITRPSTQKDKSRQLTPDVSSSDTKCSCMKPLSFQNLEVNIWRCANEILAVPSPMTKEDLELEDDYSDDTTIRAVVEGWDKIENKVLSPLWKKVRLIDQFIFSRCSPVERLAAIISTHLMLRYQHDPGPGGSEALPAWFRERPSQTLPHPLGVDFFCWPGVRERLIFDQHSYCTNEFWHVLTTNFKMLWSDVLDNCYVYDYARHQYAISPDFRRRVEDINAWTVQPDFFARFPDLHGDIPSMNSIPQSLLLPDVEKDARRKKGHRQPHAAIPALLDHGNGRIGELSAEWVMPDSALVSDALPLQANFVALMESAEASNMCSFSVND